MLPVRHFLSRCSPPYHPKRASPWPNCVRAVPSRRSDEAIPTLSAVVPLVAAASIWAPWHGIRIHPKYPVAHRIHQLIPGCYSRACADRIGRKYAERLRRAAERRRRAYERTSGWVIPTYIVMCESKGQNLPPNSAGASGYYQDLPSTWRAYGGRTANAYEASKEEQDRVNARIWREGGASQWVCS